MEVWHYAPTSEWCEARWAQMKTVAMIASQSSS